MKWPSSRHPHPNSSKIATTQFRKEDIAGYGCLFEGWRVTVRSGQACQRTNVISGQARRRVNGRSLSIGGSSVRN
jgi:hypothetical protein